MLDEFALGSMALTYQVADTLKEADLAARIRKGLVGPAAAANTTEIVWQDRGDEVLLHLPALQVRLVSPALYVAVDLESDQTGRGSLIVRFAFGDSKDPAGLFATTDELVRGHSQLAARWGPIFRDLVWSALVRLSRDHAAERGMEPSQINIGGGSIQFTATESLPLPERVNQIVNPPPKWPPRPKPGHYS